MSLSVMLNMRTLATKRKERKKGIPTMNQTMHGGGRDENPDDSGFQGMESIML